MRRAMLPAAGLSILVLSTVSWAEQLKEFTSVEGKFKVLLPGQPNETMVKAGKTLVKMTVLKLEDGTYTVNYADVQIPDKEPEEKIQQQLDKTAESMVQTGKGKLLKLERVTLEGKYPGRLVEAEVAGMKGQMRARIYLVGRRLYQVMVVGSPALVSSADAGKFLESFTLTP